MCRWAHFNLIYNSACCNFSESIFFYFLEMCVCVWHLLNLFINQAKKQGPNRWWLGPNRLYLNIVIDSFNKSINFYFISNKKFRNKPPIRSNHHRSDFVYLPFVEWKPNFQITNEPNWKRKINRIFKCLVHF